jgi:hypothetical protein
MAREQSWLERQVGRIEGWVGRMSLWELLVPPLIVFLSAASLATDFESKPLSYLFRSLSGLALAWVLVVVMLRDRNRRSGQGSAGSGQG